SNYRRENTRTNEWVGESLRSSLFPSSFHMMSLLLRSVGGIIVTKSKWMRELPLHLMILPGVIIVLIYSYGPMAGIVIAFQKFVPAKGFFNSAWIGFGNFTYVMELPDTFEVKNPFA